MYIIDTLGEWMLMAIILIVIAMIGVAVLKHRRKVAAERHRQALHEQELQPFVEWLERSEARLETDESFADYKLPYEYMRERVTSRDEMYPRYKEVVDRVRRRIAQDEAKRRYRDREEVLRTSSDHAERFRILYSLYTDWDEFQDIVAHTYTLEGLFAELLAEAESYIQEIISRCRADDEYFEQSGWVEMHSVMHLIRGDTPTPELPTEWLDIVARSVEAPSLSQFLLLEDERSMPSPGEVRLMAADALRTRDFTGAQIALAYADYGTYSGAGKGMRFPYRDAIGHTRLAELATLVAELQHGPVKDGEREG